MAGKEAFNLGMRPDAVLDRRFDGNLVDDPEHFAQDSILPMTAYCSNKECAKYGDRYFGSCFLIQELNEDKTCECLFFATAAHNLYCASCSSYRLVKPILKWKAGLNEASSFLLDAEDLSVSERGFYGWMKVSEGYILKNSKKEQEAVGDKECYPFDYGILAVRIAGIKKAGRYRKKVRQLGMFAAPPERHDFVELAYLCGYPAEVCNKSATRPPQGPTGNEEDLKYRRPESMEDGYYKWKVHGGRFFMPPERSFPGQEATGEEDPSELREAERQTAALYPLPQSHGEKICEKQNSEVNKARLYRHYIDSSEGQSGSPVYVFKEEGGDINEQCVAMGIHIGLWKSEESEEEGAGIQKKEMGFNVAVRLHGHVLSEMKRWVDNNKATDKFSADADIQEEPEEFEMVLQPPTFFGSNRAEPGTAAQARQPEPSQPHDVNPWQSREYLQNRDKLLKRMPPSKVVAFCYTSALLSAYALDDTRAMTRRSEQNEAILLLLQVEPAYYFGEFREILRCVDCEDIAEELDLVGPDPATYLGLRRPLLSY